MNSAKLPYFLMSIHERIGCHAKYRTFEEQEHRTSLVLKFSAQVLSGRLRIAAGRFPLLVEHNPTMPKHVQGGIFEIFLNALWSTGKAWEF